MKISFELEPADIERFHEALARAERRVACADECDIIEAARHGLQTLPIECAPGYIRRRLLQVVELVEMLEDEAWALPQPERSEVLKLLAYFSDPEDMIPDDVEVIGLLDDAIMLELLLRQIRHVLAAYDDFRAAREALGEPADAAARVAQARELARRRGQLQARMRRRRVRETLARVGGAAGA